MDNARPSAATATLQEGSVATALALKRWYPDGADDKSDGISLLAAVGMQDGTIQLWSHRGGGNTILVQEAILKGHGASILTLEWIKVQQSQGPIKRNEAHITSSGRLVLLSGSEDQSLRSWDVDSVLHEQKTRRRMSMLVEEEGTEVEEIIGEPANNEDLPIAPAILAAATAAAVASTVPGLTRGCDPAEASLDFANMSAYDSTAVTGLARAAPAAIPVFIPGPPMALPTAREIPGPPAGGVAVRKIPQTPFAEEFAPRSTTSSAPPTPALVPLPVLVPIPVSKNPASSNSTSEVPLSTFSGTANGNTPADGAAGAPKKQPSIKKVASSTSLLGPSLGAKGLLPPAPPKAETATQQAELQAALLGVAMRVVGGPVAQPHAAMNGGKLPEDDYFTNLGCIVDPFSGVDSLQHASARLLEGPVQPPAVARVAAQRAAAVALWSGDVGTALRILLKHDALTADFVSLSAVAGRGAWEAASRAYASVLEERGEPHLAALHLLSVGDPTAACAAYTRAGMTREAATLAASRLPPCHPTVRATRTAYAVHLENKKEWERAAAQHVAGKDWEKAVAALRTRGTVGSLQIAMELVEIGRRSKELDNETSEHLRTLITQDLTTLNGSSNTCAANQFGKATKSDAAVPEGANGLRRRYSGAELEAVRVKVESNGAGQEAQARVANQLPAYMRPQY